MEEIVWYYVIVVAGVFACACSQILLKKSANEKHKNFIYSLLNWKVIAAYGISFGVLAFNIMAMSKGVNLKDMPILESLGYVFVPLLSLVVLKEKITKWTVVSIVMIISGIIVFYL